ncbi:MAG: MBL fold metallo-hydrolase [Candidatus Bathyarchaeota archaeon]
MSNCSSSKIRDLKITTLAENLTMTSCLAQWGLSFLMELSDSRGNSRKVIFDTGLHKESLLYNIRKLELDLSDLDCIVISHGHGDHTAATVELVEAAGGVTVYAHPHVFLSRIHEDTTGKRREHGVPKGEGINEIEKAGGTVFLTTEPVEIVPGVWTTGQIQRVTSFEQVTAPSEGEKRIIIVRGEEINDQIMDDQALWMDVEGDGAFVITGCAHAGPVNTLLHVQRIGNFERIYGLVGGTHLVARSEKYLQQTINELKHFQLSLISPCHCTGFKATAILWKVFPESFILNFSGRVIDTRKIPERRVI